MALQTLRNISMPCMMAGGAIKLRMLRYVCFHLLVQLRMAHVTATLQGTLGRDAQWSVHLGVTCGTLCKVRSVYRLVTGLTFRKDFFIFHPPGAVDMESYMALFTVNPVFTTLGLYKVIKVWMTLPALFWF